MERTLEEKVERAIKILRMPRCEVEIAYSGGKDSDVILELAKMAGIDYRAIYKNTTIDPPGTIQHCKDMGVEIIRPKKTFFQLIEERGFPNRFARFCCAELKEYKIMDTAVHGIRRCESGKRAKLYDPREPIKCRIYRGEHTNVVLPILEWSNDDVREFIRLRGLRCAPTYYDERGKFCVDRRLGCMGCPLASRNGLDDFIKYPKLAKAWINAGARYMQNKPNSRAVEIFDGDPYAMFVKHTFFGTMHEFELATDGMFGKVDCKQFLEDYFKIELK